MIDFEDCMMCNGDGHVEGDVIIDCGFCYGTGQTRIDDEYARKAVQPERNSEPRKAA